MLNFMKNTALLALVASLPSLSRAHTWSEELQVIGPNGSYIGDRGYMRGYVARTDPTFDGDSSVLWLLPALDARMPDETVRLRINSSDYLCHPSQRTSNYSNPEYPKLKVSPGGYVAMKYLENGHVTLPWDQPGKPLQGGTAFVYGTTKPSTSEKIADVLQWNANGTGGDGRGWLMTAQTYDDGRCHQINDCVNSAVRQVQFPLQVTGQPTSTQQEQWCETDLKVPDNQPLGDLTVYWVWQWTTQANVACTYPTGKDEYYTSCIDMEIVDGGKDDINIQTEIATNTLVQECFQTTAVSTYKQRTALTASPTYMLDNWNEVVGTTTAASAAFTSSCVAVLSSVAANAGVIPPSCPAGLYATGALYASISSSVVQASGAQIALVTAAASTGLAREVVGAAATTQGQGLYVAPAASGAASATAGNSPAVTGGSAAPTGSAAATTGSSSASTGSAAVTTESAAPPTTSNAASVEGTETIDSTIFSTKTMTRYVTVSSSSSVAQAAASPGASQGQTQAFPNHGGQWGSGKGWSGGEHHFHFNTISTAGQAPAATTSASAPEDVVVGPSGVADEDLQRHRRHARHFA